MLTGVCTNQECVLTRSVCTYLHVPNRLLIQTRRSRYGIVSPPNVLLISNFTCLLTAKLQYWFQCDQHAQGSSD